MNYGTLFVSVADCDKEEALPLVRRFYNLGFNIEATEGTAKFLKENGYKVVAVSEKSAVDYTTLDYCDPIALVMGAEDVGISPEVLKLTDYSAAIPMFGKIGSLNVSVAAGVMMYEVVRQRLAHNLEIN